MEQVRENLNTQLSSYRMLYATASNPFEQQVFQERIREIQYLLTNIED